MSEARPAFYALAPGGWRDLVTLLHPPYTLWHLSYVAIGAAIAPTFDAALLGWTLLAFFVAIFCFVWIAFWSIGAGGLFSL